MGVAPGSDVITCPPYKEIFLNYVSVISKDRKRSGKIKIKVMEDSTSLVTLKRI